MKGCEAKHVGWHANNVLIAICLLAVTVASGCSESGSGRQSVTGSVSHDGIPLKSGTISFFPSAAGTTVGAKITDGAFSIPASKGLLPGEYRIEIESWIDTGEQVQGDPADPDSMAAGRRQIIPEKFNVKSKLKVTVSESNENMFDFTLDD